MTTTKTPSLVQRLITWCEANPDTVMEPVAADCCLLATYLHEQDGWFYEVWPDTILRCSPMNDNRPATAEERQIIAWFDGTFGKPVSAADVAVELRKVASQLEARS